MNTLLSAGLLQEVAREAEERERVAIAAKKARQEQETKKQALKSSPKSAPVVSVAESTSHELMDVTGTVLKYNVTVCYVLMLGFICLKEGEGGGGGKRVASKY